MDSGPPFWRSENPELADHVAGIINRAQYSSSPDYKPNCWCTGECGGDRRKCPVFTAPRPTFAEAVEEAVQRAERLGEPHLAEAIRQAVKDTPNG